MSTLKVNTIQDTTGNDALTIDSSGNVTASQGFVPSTQLSHRNLIINGGFDVWQRGTSFTSISKEYNADRWWVNQLSTVGTMSRQSSSLDGFKYCLRVQRNSGNTSTSATYLSQDLESVNSIKTIGQKVTLSFYARKGADFSAASDQLTVKLVSGTGTDQTLNNGYTGGANVINQTPTLTTSWQRFTYTSSAVVASSVNQLGVQIIRGNVGTAGTNDYYEITGVQLEVGSAATPFEHRSYGEELARCQRYYQQLDYDDGDRFVANGFAQNSSESKFIYQYHGGEMRAAPTVSEVSVTNGYRYETGTDNIYRNNIPNKDLASRTQISFGNNANTITGEKPGRMRLAASGARIKFDAEL